MSSHQILTYGRRSSDHRTTFWTEICKGRNFVRRGAATLTGVEASHLNCQGSKYEFITKNATLVLVHGAWTDGGSWSQVVLRLLDEDLKVVCAPIPFTSLSNDIAALNRVVERTEGSVLLARRAHAGAVIAGNVN